VSSIINPLNLELLKRRFASAQPFPHVVIDDFLEPAAAAAIAQSYPTFDQALRDGFAFNFVNEQRKVQITDRSRFPEAVRGLHDAISARSFLDELEKVTGIPRLLADEQLSGGGMHLTGSGGRLDVHVDFNRIEDRQLFRRLNILVYLNPVWKEEWGGHIELWDRDVKTCHQRCVPALNRCLIFETSDISYHGVAPITAPAAMVRQSFAAYYYTREAPPKWDGRSHSTIFRARPDEQFRRFVSMPAERIRRRLESKVKRSKELIKGLIGLK
jgi:Rps23 Pro-64 3,4-dihydroxylase Tpa1-like proline 4-hydroxylase